MNLVAFVKLELFSMLAKEMCKAYNADDFSAKLGSSGFFSRNYPYANSLNDKDIKAADEVLSMPERAKDRSTPQLL